MINSNWLRTNVTAIIAVFWTVLTATVVLLILLKGIDLTDKMLGVISSVFTTEGIVMGYYFVSSKSNQQPTASTTISKIISVTDTDNSDNSNLKNKDKNENDKRD